MAGSQPCQHQIFICLEQMTSQSGNIYYNNWVAMQKTSFIISTAIFKPICMYL